MDSDSMKLVWCTVLRARIIFLKCVHPAKRARAQKLYIVSSYHHTHMPLMKHLHAYG